MTKKILIPLLSFFFISFGVFALVTLVFLITPSSKARSSIHLPKQIEDPVVDESEEATSDSDSTYDNIYLADVHNSLTLRTEPDSNSEPVIPEGLSPMTHMQIIYKTDDGKFAYVKVITGPYTGYEGFVNCEYITKLGEPTIRVWEQE